jgi:hypothetical protein
MHFEHWQVASHQNNNNNNNNNNNGTWHIAQKF